MPEILLTYKICMENVVTVLLNSVMSDVKP